MIVAYHEIGHALVAAKQTNSAPVQKITIVPRTSGALGYTMQVEEGNHYLMTKEELENKIATLTGGRAAEEVVFSCVTTGASNDIEQATKLARAMITRYGMSKDFDMVAMEAADQPVSGRRHITDLFRRDTDDDRPKGRRACQESSMKRLHRSCWKTEKSWMKFRSIFTRRKRSQAKNLCRY